MSMEQELENEVIIEQLRKTIDGKNEEIRSLRNVLDGFVALYEDVLLTYVKL